MQCCVCRSYNLHEYTLNLLFQTTGSESHMKLHTCRFYCLLFKVNNMLSGHIWILNFVIDCLIVDYHLWQRQNILLYIPSKIKANGSFGLPLHPFLIILQLCV